MDFKGYLDLVLAIELRETPQAMKFWWNLIDDGKDTRSGKISEKHALFLIRSVLDTLILSGKVMPASIPFTENDVYDEFCDMLGLHDQMISWKSIEKSRIGSSILAMLTDANAFYLYDNREAILIQPTALSSAGS